MDSFKFDRFWVTIAIVLILFFVIPPYSIFAAPCASPPSGAGVSILPNVLIIFDNSGSMLAAAYVDEGWDYFNPTVCEDYNPNATYYGVFDPTKRYNYNSSGMYFEEAQEGEWSGNFLNWVGMTRIDVARTVLTGGRVVESGGSHFLATNIDARYWLNEKRYRDTSNQTPFNNQGWRYYRVRGSSFCDRASWLEVCTDSNYNNCTDGYYLRRRVSADFQATGLLHQLKDKVRLGLMFFNHSQGGRILKYIKKLDATQLQEIVAEINKSFCDWDRGCPYIETTWTPLAETLYEATRYFAQQNPYYYSSDYDPDRGDFPEDPMYNEDYEGLVWCARNYIILLTDGESTQDLNIPSGLRDADGDDCETDGTPACPCGNDNCGFGACSCSEYPWDSDGSTYLDDIAYYAHNTDLRSDLDNEQNITLHTVYLFGKEGAGDILLQKAAANGGGNYYMAEDADQTAAALESIFEEITLEAAAASSVAVSSEPVSGTDLIYVPYYKHPQRDLWWGNIRAFGLDENGYLIDSNGDPVSDIDEDGIYDNPLWDADLQVAQKAGNDSRTIFTFISGNQVDFNTANASTLGGYFDVDLDNDGNKDETSEVNALISYIRGDDNPSGGFSLRDRDGHYMGDIIYSSPVFSGKPAARFDLTYGDNSYWNYYWENSDRREVVFIGANDGMLHTFDANDGEEIWSYIPYNLLPHLKWLADPDYCHCFYVDLSSKVWDIKLTDGWKSILLGGMRIGGTPIDVDTDNNGSTDTTLRSAYFALDVTDPEEPVVKWEINDERFGYTTSKPIAVKVGDNWYVVFGSGPKTRDGKGYSTDDGYTDTNGYIFVVDPNDGSIVRTFSLGSRGANNFFGSPVAVDYDLDYSVDVIYIGDAKGNLWRIKTFTGSGASKTYAANPNGWTVDVDPSTPDIDPLLSLSPSNADQPILMKPSVSFDDSGRLWIYVGTGRYLCYNDNICCAEGVDCPPDATGGSCPSGNGCSITETINGSDETRSIFMAVGVFDRYWDQANGNFALADSTITLSDLDHRVIISGSVTGNEALTGYAIVDDQYPSQDIATNVEGKGWYFHLLEDRERCISDFLVYREVVFFLTYIPATAAGDPCSGGGTSNLYGVYYTSGTSTITPVFDLTGEGVINEGDTVSIGEDRAVGAAILKLDKGFAGGSPKAKGDVLYLPMGLTVPVNPPGSPYQTGVTSWKEVWE